MKYVLTLLILVTQYCSAQIDISPSINILSGGRMSDLTSIRLNNYRQVQDSIGIGVVVIYDSIIVVNYRARLLLDSSWAIILNDSTIEGKGYTDKIFWLKYHQKNHLPEGNYSVFYEISTKGENDTFNVNIHIGKPIPPKKKLIRPILDLSISSDYSFYDGQPTGVLNRDLNVSLKGGIFIKDIPLDVDVKFNTDYHNFGVGLTPAFLGFDENTFRGNILQKADGLIKDDKFNEQLNQNEFSHLEQDMVTIRELASDSGLMSKLPLYKKLDSLKKMLADTMHLVKDTSSSKKTDSTSNNVLSTKSADTLVRHYQDSVKKEISSIKKSISIDSLKKMGLKLFGSDSSKKSDSSLITSVDSLKKVYAKAANYSKLIDSFNNIKKLLGGDLSKLELLDGKDSVSGKLASAVQQAKPILQYENDPQKLLSSDLTKKYIFNSSKFSKLEKALFSIKAFKIGRFTNTGPNYFLGNSNLLGFKIEAEVKNVYCLLAYGKDQQTRFTFNKYFSNKNSLLVAGTGLHFNDKNFFHVLFKRGEGIDTTTGESLKKFNYVFGQNSSIEPLKFLRIITSTYVSSSSLVQDDLVPSPASEAQVLSNLFNRNSNITMWGFVNEVSVQAAVTKKITLDYRSLLLSSSYLSQGLDLINNNKQINEIGFSGSFLKDKLKLKLRYVRNAPLTSVDNYHSTLNQILTNTSFSVKKVQFSLLLNNLFYEKQLSNLTSTFSTKYTKQLKYSSFSNVLTLNYNIGFDSVLHLQSENYGAQYTFIGTIKQKNSFSISYSYQYNLSTEQIVDIQTIVGSYQNILSKKLKLKFDSKFFYQQKTIKIAVNSYLTLTLTKKINLELKAGYGKYINSNVGVSNYDEYPLAFKLKYSL